MPELTRFQIEEHALLVSLINVKTGKEFQVAERLSRRFAADIRYPAYYTCYGQYDLAELLTVGSLEAVHEVPYDRDVIDFESSLFYSWKDVSFPITDWGKSHPALVLVLLKIQPNLEQAFRLTIERAAINHIRQSFAGDSNIFLGMGRSEILLLLRGRDLGRMLDNVSKLRQTTTMKELAVNDMPLSAYDPEFPIFADSVTFPLIAHPALKKRDAYDEFEGNVIPTVSVVCNPGCEHIVAKSRPASSSGAYNVYGNYDITIVWKEEVPLAQFAREITEFRETMSKIEGIRRTSTSFLGSSPTKVSVKALQEKGGEIEATACTDAILSIRTGIDPIINAVKARLIEFFGKLNSCYSQKEYRQSFEDMLGICAPINWALTALPGAPLRRQYQLCNQLLEIIDLSNNGIHQRYAGLETRYDTSKHLPYPSLQGINGFIAAASYVPCFIFKAMFPDRRIKEVWPGFVLFGPSYSYQMQDGRILSYPATSVLRPIEDWLGITHEVAHAIYRALGLYKKILPEDVQEYLNRSAHKVPSGIENFIDELYSSWFDFRYIFGGNVARYFTTIWNYWLRWGLIWSKGPDYLLRSFMVFLTIDIAGFKKAHNQGFDEEMEYFWSKFKEMIELVQPSVTDFDSFYESVKVDRIKEIIELTAIYMHSLLIPLDSRFDEQVFRRLNPSYSEESLCRHVDSLSQGIIITEPIPNPISLLYEIYHKYTINQKPVPLKTTAATVLTFWLQYMSNEYV